jgi:hypothetical protein
MLDMLDTRDTEISAVRESADLGHDLALWAEDAGPVLDGPVLVQLKLWSALSSHTLKAAVNAFAEQLNRQPVPFGLLVYHSTSGDQRGPVSVEPKQARVVAVSAHELVDMLSRQPLSRVLISFRNAVMHGVSYRA